METIIPCRKTVSERFPLASFMINVPEGRIYEVVCATDPRLFHPRNTRFRSLKNFYSSRTHGLLRSAGDRHTYLVPQEQLNNLAGNSHLFYAMGTYGNPQGDDPSFSISPFELNRTPSIRLAPNLNNSLQVQSRRRFAYGSPKPTAEKHPVLRWGGDDALATFEQKAQSALQQNEQTDFDEYDDGFDSALWSEEPPSHQPYENVYDTGSSTNRSENPAMTPPHHDQGAIVSGQAISTMGYRENMSTPRHGDEASPYLQANAFGLVNNMDFYARPSTRHSNRRYGDPDYQSSMPEQSLPVGPSSLPLGESQDDMPTPVAFTIPEQVRLSRIVSEGIPGSQLYSTTLVDDHSGLRWGLSGFRQKTGDLGRVLKKAQERETKLAAADQLPPEQSLAALFGAENLSQLLTQTDPDITTDPNQRMHVIAEGPLWQEPWLGRFQQAGSIPYIQYSQNEIAIETVAGPAAKLASWIGLNSAKGISVVMDRIIAMGEGGAAAWLLELVGPVRNEADRLNALQAVTGNQDLSAFQRSKGIEANGIWNPITHAALTGALRELGAASPLMVMTPAQMMVSIASGAGGAPFADRINRLLRHADLSDAFNYQLNSRSNSTPALQPDGTASYSGREAAPFSNGSYTLNWDEVQQINQPTNTSCWAAAGAMVVGWRDQMSLSPAAIAQITGRTAATGLDPRQVESFARELGLVYEHPMSYTEEGFRQLLGNNGPLWVAASVPDLHAIVVTGLYNDGSQTYVRITDPWDRAPGTPGNPGNYLNTHNTGSRYILTWEAFVREYESAATDFSGVNLQILHSGGTNGRQPNRGMPSPPPGYAQSLPGCGSGYGSGYGFAIQGGQVPWQHAAAFNQKEHPCSYTSHAAGTNCGQDRGGM